MNSQVNNPMAEYLFKLQLIIKASEFKNREEANKYETPESRTNGDKYINAKRNRIYLSHIHMTKGKSICF